MNKFMTRIVAVGLFSLALDSVFAQSYAIATPAIIYVHGQQDDAAPAASASDYTASDYGNSGNGGYTDGTGKADSQGEYNPFDPSNPHSIYNPSSCPRGVYC